MSLYPAVRFSGVGVTEEEHRITLDSLETDKQPVEQVVYQFVDNVLDVHVKFKPEKSKAILLSFDGELLAGKAVGLDKRTITVPQRFEKHEFPHARKMTFFSDTPQKQMTIEIDGVHFANLRDYRNQPNRRDFQVFVHTKKNSTAHMKITLGPVAENTQPQADKQTKPKQNAIAKKSNADKLKPDISKLRLFTPSWAKRDALALATSTMPVNLLPNPGFEADLSSWTWGITSYTMPDRDLQSWHLDAQVKRTGRQSLRYDVKRGQVPPMACTMPFATQPGKTYTVSFYAKPQHAGMRTSVFLQTDTWPKFQGKRYTLKDGWQRYTCTFKAINAMVRIGLGDPWAVINRKDQRDGSIWFDDVQLHEGDGALDFTQQPLQIWSDTQTREQYLFTSQPKSTVSIHAANTTSQSQQVTLKVDVQDVWGKTHHTQTFTSDIAANQRKTFEIPLESVKLKGMLRLNMHAELAWQKTQVTAYGRVARLVDLSQSDLGAFRYAQRRDWVLPRDVPFLKQLGVRGTLSFFLPKDPSVIEQFNAMDFLHIVTMLSKRDLDVPHFHDARYTDADLAKLEKALGQRLPAYAAQPVWKTINEPNTSGYMSTPEDCAKAVTLFAQKAKAVNPNAVVLTPDPYNASRSGQSWLDQFFKAGGNRAVDAVSIHTYRARPEDPDLATDISRLIDLKARHGLSDAPIYFTEGEGTCPYNVPEMNATPLRGFYPWRLGPVSQDVGHAERLAAAMMCRTLLACLANREHVRYYLNWYQEEAPQLQPMPGHPDVSMAAINNLLNLVGNRSLHSEQLIGDDSRTYVFAGDDGSTVTATWLYDLKVDRGESEGKEFTMPKLPAGWKLLDFQGNPVPVKQEQDRLAMMLASHPVFLVTPAGSVDDVLKHLKQTQIGGLGAQSVALQLRRTSATAGVIQVVNRLPQTNRGKLSIKLNNSPLTQATLNIAPKMQQKVDITLPATQPGVYANAAIDAVFTPADDASPVTRRWQQQALSVPHIKRDIQIDGDPSDWSGHKPLRIDGSSQIWTWLKQQTWHGRRDLDAQLYMGYKSDGLYMCVVVQ
ncbi:MAG: glycosyl hydrolase, partial [Phycisphaeraceae bacterium JB051]